MSTNPAGLAALTLLDALDRYLEASPSWTAMRMAQTLIQTHHIENLDAWPMVQDALANGAPVTVGDLAVRGHGFAQTVAGVDDGAYRVSEPKHSQHYALMSYGADMDRKRRKGE